MEDFRKGKVKAADALKGAIMRETRGAAKMETVQQLLMDGALEMGHARALLPLPSARQIQLGQHIAARGLSVREAETLATHAPRPAHGRAKPRAEPDRDLLRLQEELSDSLATNVTVRADAKGKGQIRIDFASLDQLQGLIERLRS